MTATLSTAAVPSQGHCLDDLGLLPAKAELRMPSFRVAMANGIRAHYGPLKVCAISLGDVDPSQLLREWKRGDFDRVDRYADAEAKAFISAYVAAALGQEQDPKLRAKALLRDMRARLDEIDLCIERLL